jgi:hypothetical protein
VQRKQPRLSVNVSSRRLLFVSNGAFPPVFYLAVFQRLPLKIPSGVGSAFTKWDDVVEHISDTVPICPRDRARMVPFELTPHPSRPSDFSVCVPLNCRRRCVSVRRRAAQDKSQYDRHDFHYSSRTATRRMVNSPVSQQQPISCTEIPDQASTETLSKPTCTSGSYPRMR